jgi:hypothetical protein
VRYLNIRNVASLLFSREGLQEPLNHKTLTEAAYVYLSENKEDQNVTALEAQVTYTLEVNKKALISLYRLTFTQLIKMITVLVNEPWPAIRNVNLSFPSEVNSCIILSRATLSSFLAYSLRLSHIT